MFCKQKVYILLLIPKQLCLKEPRLAISTWVDKPIYDEVRKLAYDEQTTVSELLRTIVAEALALRATAKTLAQRDNKTKKKGDD